MPEQNAKITIFGEEIQVSDRVVNINDLKFLAENPRVFSLAYGTPRFRSLSDAEQQELMYEQLLKQQSVKKLIPEVKLHEGLMESILVRWDTKEVIEGNSRLAVYRKLYKESGEDEKWKRIRCRVISSLSKEQLYAYLNQIHVKGKTTWSAYEKANFVYVRKENGFSIGEIAAMFGESEKEIEKRIKIIEAMKRNRDTKQSHFSYYEVLVTNKKISERLKENKDLRDVVLNNIKRLPSNQDDETYFKAEALRRKLPVIIGKPKAVKSYIKGEHLDDVYQRVKPSNAQKKIRQAKEYLKGIEKKELTSINQSDRGAIKQDIKKGHDNFSMSKTMLKYCYESEKQVRKPCTHFGA